MDESLRSVLTESSPCRDRHILPQVNAYLKNKKELLLVNFHVTVYTKKKEAKEAFEWDKSTRVAASGDTTDNGYI